MFVPKQSMTGFTKPDEIYYSIFIASRASTAEQEKQKTESRSELCSLLQDIYPKDRSTLNSEELTAIGKEILYTAKVSPVTLLRLWNERVAT